MQQKFLLLLSCIVGATLCTFALSLYFFFSTNIVQETFTQLPTVDPLSSSESTSTVAQGSTYVKVGTPSEDIYIRDPRTIAGVEDMGGGIYAVTSLSVSRTTHFGVIYNETDASLAVSLDEEPLAVTRREAEEYIRSLLGVSDEQLCKLQIFIGTADVVNPFYAGKNLGLSFCPGSVSLD